MRRSRRDDEERRPRDMWRATSREKAKPTIGRSSRKLFFRSGGARMHVAGRRVGRVVEHLRSRLGTLELVVLSTDARSSFLSTATLDPRGADPLCSIADRQQLFTLGILFHVKSTWRKPIYPFYVNHLSRRMGKQYRFSWHVVLYYVFAILGNGVTRTSTVHFTWYRPRALSSLGTDASWYSFSRGSPVAMARSPSS